MFKSSLIHYVFWYGNHVLRFQQRQQPPKIGNSFLNFLRAKPRCC